MKQLGFAASFFGAISLVVGLFALTANSAAAGVVAGLCGLAAGGAGAVLAGQVRSQQESIATTEVRIEQLEKTAAKQIQARVSAEADAEVAKQDAEKAKIGNDLLADRIRTIRSNTTGNRSKLTDPLTGLFGEEYFTASVDSRVAAARRHLRPVSVVIIEVVNGVSAENVGPADPVGVGKELADSLREADIVCRLSDGRFALILEDTPEVGAIWTVERFRRSITGAVPDATVWAGIAGYPAHAFDADSVVRLADEALHSAREWGRDRIEVAPNPA